MAGGDDSCSNDGLESQQEDRDSSTDNDEDRPESTINRTISRGASNEDVSFANQNEDAEPEATTIAPPETASSTSSCTEMVDQDDAAVCGGSIERKSDSADEEITTRTAVKDDVPINHKDLHDASKDTTQQHVESTTTRRTTRTATTGFPATARPSDETKSAGSKEPYFLPPTRRLSWLSPRRNQEVEESTGQGTSKTPYFFDPARRLPAIRPPPTPNSAGNTLGPGAHPVMAPLPPEVGINRRFNQQLQRPNDNDVEHSSSENAAELFRNNNEIDYTQAGLVEAVPITLVEQPAEEVPHPAHRRHKDDKCDVRCGFLSVAMAMGIAILIVMVRVAVARRQADKASSSQDGPLSPQQFLLQLLPNYTVRAIDLDYIDYYNYNMLESSNNSSSSNSNNAGALSSRPFSFNHLHNVSSQTKAILWTIRDPNFDIYPEWRLVQRFALACLYYATGGDSWHRSYNWLSYDVDEHQWYCYSSYKMVRPESWYDDVSSYLLASLLQEEGLLKRDGGGLGRLWLSDNGLEGTIPPEVFLLTSVRTLDLQGNSLGGTLPSQIGTLDRLEAVSFYRNQLTGRVPSEIGQLSGLLALDISRNQFTGKIWPEVGMLQAWVVIAGYNNFEGPIPTQLGLMTHLLALRFQKNLLTGSIPTELGHLSTLQDLDISLNQFTGSLPTELGNLVQNPLGFIDFYGNVIAKKIRMGYLSSDAREYFSVAFRNGAAIMRLNFGGNLISGSIPTELGLMYQAEDLRLLGNLLTGRIPSELGGLSQLKSLSFADNFLFGSIPSQLGGLTDLDWLIFSSNMLSGRIPSELGLLSQLISLFLSDNMLTGAIPSHFGSLTDLQLLSLEGNTLLTGLVPDDLCFLESSNLLFDCSPTLCGCHCVCLLDTLTNSI